MMPNTVKRTLRVQVEINGINNIEKSLRKDVKKIINNILKAADLPDYSINISLVDNEEMLDLCKRFKDKNSVTDVLSFPLPEEEKMFAHCEFILGDVVICLPQALRQAEELGHSLLEEVAVLVAHGFFHLTGLDHEKSDSEANIQMQGEMYLLEMAGLKPELSLIGRI